MKTFFDIHTHSTLSSNQVFTIQNRYPTSDDFSKPFSIGLHPWFLKNETAEMELSLLEEKLQYPNCFALGECGLDKAIETNFNFQKSIFIKQIHLSEKYQKPIIIHCVRAFQEIIEIKKAQKPLQPWIIHGFQKDKQLAFSLIENGFYLSFGEAVLKSAKTQEVISVISMDKIFMETDNSEVSIQEIYQKISHIKKVSLEKLKEQIHINFTHIFTS
jgi:TatD DNase family protein